MSRIRKWSFSILKTFAIIFVLSFLMNWFQTRNIKSPSDLSCLQNSKAKTFTGGEIYTKDLMKPNTLIYIWAPWCSVCRFSAPGLTEFMKDKEINFFTIGLDDDDFQNFKSFANEVGFSEQRTFVGDDQFRECLGVGAYPSYYLISESGKRSLSSVGYTTKFMLWLRIQLAKVL